MRRRDFLTTVAAAAALPHVNGTTLTAAPPPAAPLKFGLASYSARNFPLDTCLEMAKAMDVQYLNFKDVHIPRKDPLDVEAIKAARAKVEAAGFTITGGGTITFRNDEAAIRRDFEYARLAGMPLIVAAPSTDSLDAVEKVAKEYKIRVAIHNHGPEDKFFPSPYDAYKAIKGRDPLMGLCIDIGHSWRAGADPAKAVLDLRDRVYDMHVKDLANLKERDSQVIVGKGAIDFPALLRALITIKFAGNVALEYEIHPKDPLPGMLQSVAYLRGVLAALTSTT
jgi:sugar phosphate isomerase/epimerase